MKASLTTRLIGIAIAMLIEAVLMGIVSFGVFKMLQFYGSTEVNARAIALTFFTIWLIYHTIKSTWRGLRNTKEKQEAMDKKLKEFGIEYT